MPYKDAAPLPDGAEAGLTDEELEAEVALDLPDREALSLAFPLAVATTPALASKTAVAATQAAPDAPIEPTS